MTVQFVKEVLMKLCGTSLFFTWLWNVGGVAHMFNQRWEKHEMIRGADQRCLFKPQGMCPLRFMRQIYLKCRWLICRVQYAIVSYHCVIVSELLSALRAGVLNRFISLCYC